MVTAKSKGLVKRGQLARLAGCNIETVRYYENIGLMPEPARTASGHRIYAYKDQARLRFILRSRDLGFSLNDIRSLLGIEDCKPSCEHVYALTQQHLENLRAKIADLQKLEKTLADMAKNCAHGHTPDCPIIDALTAQQ